MCGGAGGGRVKLKQWVLEKGLPISQEGNRTEGFKRHRLCWEVGSRSSLPCRARWAQARGGLGGPGRLAHLVPDFPGLCSAGSVAALATFYKGVPRQLDIPGLKLPQNRHPASS